MQNQPKYYMEGLPDTQNESLPLLKEESMNIYFENAPTFKKHMTYMPTSGQPCTMVLVDASLNNIFGNIFSECCSVYLLHYANYLSSFYLIQYLYYYDIRIYMALLCCICVNK
jgi:hypothetical protein